MLAIGSERGEESTTFLRGVRYRELPGDSPSQNLEQLSFTCYPPPIFDPRCIGGSLSARILRLRGIARPDVAQRYVHWYRFSITARDYSLSIVRDGLKLTLPKNGCGILSLFSHMTYYLNNNLRIKNILSLISTPVRKWLSKCVDFFPSYDLPMVIIIFILKNV